MLPQKILLLYTLSDFQHLAFTYSNEDLPRLYSLIRLPKGDLWVQSPMIIVGKSPNIRSIAENRRRSGDLPKRIVGLCPLGRA